MLTVLLAGCDPRPTPDVIGVRADSASQAVLKAACNSSRLGFARRNGADIVLDESRAEVRVSPEKGSHRITEADLQRGRVVARIQLLNGDEIRGWQIRTRAPVCLVMFGSSYDSLTTLFVSSEDGATLTRQPTQVILKARPHRRSEGDWIRISATDGYDAPADSAAGMLPRLWAALNGKVFTAQVSCGRNQCCSPRRPL
jgi:hypothetical protein